MSILFLIGSAATTYAANCSASITSNSLPCTIASPGNYSLTGYVSKSFSTAAITIVADNVVLDLGGYEMIQTNANTQVAVYSSSAQSNVTVKNGTLTNFSAGIDCQNPSNNNFTAENITVTSSTTQPAIAFSGNNNVIRNSTVRGGSGGIFLGSGQGGRIENNYVYGAQVAGIWSYQASCIIKDNSVNMSGADNIYVEGGNLGLLIINNNLMNATVGIHAFDTTGQMHGKFRNNLTSGCTNPWWGLPTGMIDAGSNN